MRRAKRASGGRASGGARRRGRRALLGCRSLLLAGALGAVGCTGPVLVQQSALVGAPKLTARRGLPLEEGELSYWLEANPILPGIAQQERAASDEPSMLVPELQLGAALQLAVSDWVEVGVHATYASVEWAKATAEDNLGLDGSDDTVFGIGPGLRINLPLGETWSLSLTGQLELLTVPTAAYDLNGELREAQLDVHILPAAAVGLSWRAKRWLGVYGSLGWSQGVRNRSFVPDGGVDDRTFGYAYYPVSAGVEIGGGPVVLRAELFDVVEDERGLDTGLGFALQLAGTTRLWGGEASSSRRRREDGRPSTPLPPRPRPLTPEEENRDDDR